MASEAAPSPTYVFALSSSLPVTSTFALPLGAYYLFLQTRVVQNRISSAQAVSHTSSQTSTSEVDPLLAAVRAQTNFAENVPFALVLAGLVELNGGSKKALSWVLGGLCVLRVLHAELGIMRKGYTGNGRPAGYFGTQGVIAGLAGWAAWLSRGYWGL